MKRRFLEDKPTMIHANHFGNPRGNTLIRFELMASYTVMLAPFGAIFVMESNVSGLWTNAGVFTPLILCAGAHLIMKMTGKSCHEGNVGDPKLIAAPVPIVDHRPGMESRSRSRDVHATRLEG